MSKIQFPNTLRIQLPLTYAGIALLATSLIGAVLYLIIGNYYLTLEQKYLDGNARGLAQNLSDLSRREYISGTDGLHVNAEQFNNRVSLAAFLMQSRVRILDAAGNVIAASGKPTKDWNIHLPVKGETPLPAQGSPLNSDDLGQPFSFSPG